MFQMEYLFRNWQYLLFQFLMMWETNARYIVNYIPMIYVAAVLGMAQFLHLLEKAGEERNKVTYSYTFCRWIFQPRLCTIKRKNKSGR